MWKFSGLEFVVFSEEVKNNLGFLFVCLGFFGWVYVVGSRTEVFCPSTRSAELVCSTQQLGKIGYLGLENGNKTQNLIGDFLRDTDSGHPLCPQCCLEIQLWPESDSFYWAVCPDLPPPFPLTLMSSSEQVETLLVLGWFVAEQFAALVSDALGVGIPRTVAAAWLPCPQGTRPATSLSWRWG